MTRCETCFYWPAKITATGICGEGGPHTDGSVSECRRRSPTERNGDRYPHADRIFPTTSRADYCGDHLIDQERERFLLSQRREGDVM